MLQVFCSSKWIFSLQNQGAPTTLIAVCGGTRANLYKSATSENLQRPVLENPPSSMLFLTVGTFVLLCTLL